MKSDRPAPWRDGGPENKAWEERRRAPRTGTAPQASGGARDGAAGQKVAGVAQGASVPGACAGAASAACGNGAGGRPAAPCRLHQGQWREASAMGLPASSPMALPSTA
eukprot:Opistho-1_new@52399